MVYIWTTCVRTHDTLGSIPMKGIYDLVIKSIARSQSLPSFLYLWWLVLVAISPTEVSSRALCMSSYPLQCLVLICHEFSFPTSCPTLGRSLLKVFCCLWIIPFTSGIPTIVISRHWWFPNIWSQPSSPAPQPFYTAVWCTFPPTYSTAPPF